MLWPRMDLDFFRTHTWLCLLIVLIGALIGLSNLRFKSDGTVGVPALCFLAVYFLGGHVSVLAGSFVGYKTIEVGRTREGGIESESIPTRDVSGSERWQRVERYSGTELYGFIGLGLVCLWLLIPKVQEGLSRKQAKMAKLDSAGERSTLTEFDVFKALSGVLCVFLVFAALLEALQKP